MNVFVLDAMLWKWLPKQLGELKEQQIFIL